MSSFYPEKFIILVVDDVKVNLQILTAILEQAGYGTTFATGGRGAVQQAKIIKPDLILLDLMMPEMDGLQVCQELKDELHSGEITVIFLTASNQDEHIVKAFELGAVDYITKPYKSFELLARVKTHLELKHTRDQLKQSLAIQANLVKELEKLANSDPLTGVANRRHIMNLIEKEFRIATEEGVIFSILIFDLDFFKKINDTYGHFVGDEVIKSAVTIAGDCLRSCDHLGRLGGEEFIALMPQTSVEDATVLAKQIRHRIAAYSLHFEGTTLNFTVSIGVACYLASDNTKSSILIRADGALYTAKRQGRNRVIVDQRR